MQKNITQFHEQTQHRYWNIRALNLPRLIVRTMTKQVKPRSEGQHNHNLRSSSSSKRCPATLTEPASSVCTAVASTVSVLQILPSHTTPAPEAEMPEEEEETEKEDESAAKRIKFSNDACTQTDALPCWCHETFQQRHVGSSNDSFSVAHVDDQTDWIAAFEEVMSLSIV
jgi:hypothetical protein